MTSALRCDMSVGYDGIVVARDIAFGVDRGRILAVLGPNGSGKTTTLLTLAGYLAPISGTIELNGRPVRPGSALRMNRDGIVPVLDSRALFTQLTTAENLSVAKRACRRPGPSVADALDLFPGLAARAGLPAGMLSGGEQQMLALARALVQAPTVLLIDEMSMGLAPVVVESLMPTIRAAADETGVAVVLVEQHVRLALEVADEGVVLVHGSVVLRQPASVLREDPSLLEAAYFGVTTARPSPSAHQTVV